MHKAVAFGHVWSSDVPLPDLLEAPADRPADISIVRAPPGNPRGSPLMEAGDRRLYRDGLGIGLGDEVEFDLYDGQRIEWRPRAGWRGVFPPELYGVGIAATLAMRGLLPLHGSAVEIDGRALLICGGSGAGKSTTAAALTRQGARLVSDDLSVVSLSPQGLPQLHLGRPAIRLFPDIARAMMPTASLPPAATGAKGKCLVHPARIEAWQPLPLERILVLQPGDSGAPTDRDRAISALLDLVYRPYWMRRLPGAGPRLAVLAAVAREVGRSTLAVGPLDDANARAAHCARVLAACRPAASG